MKELTGHRWSCPGRPGPGPSGGARAHPHAPPPGPSHYQWTRAAGACSCLPSGQDACSSGSFCLGPSPLSPKAPHGGDTQARVGRGPRRQAAEASPGWGRLGQWVAMETPQASPQGPLGSRKGPCPCLQGAAPPWPRAHSIPGPPNRDLAPTVCQALRL